MSKLWTRRLVRPKRHKTPIPARIMWQKKCLGCRKWGCNTWGLKECLAAPPGDRPFSPFFCLFRPFPEGAKSTWQTQKTEEKGLFPHISSDLLKPPSLKSPICGTPVCYCSWPPNKKAKGVGRNRGLGRIYLFCTARSDSVQEARFATRAAI